VTVHLLVSRPCDRPGEAPRLSALSPQYENGPKSRSVRVGLRHAIWQVGPRPDLLGMEPGEAEP
jgi:hypothetical protein